MEPFKQQFLVWMVEGATKYYQSKQKIEVPKFLQGQDAFMGKRNIEEHVEGFLISSLEAKPGCRVPLEWVHTQFLKESGVALTELTVKAFGKLCREILGRRFPKSCCTCPAKVTVGNTTESRTLTCIMDVFWVEDKHDELEMFKWRIRENNKALCRHGEAK